MCGIKCGNAAFFNPIIRMSLGLTSFVDMSEVGGWVKKLSHISRKPGKMSMGVNSYYFQLGYRYSR